MRGFLSAILLSVGGGVAAALLISAAPLPVLRVALALVLAACVYFAGRSGAPGAPGVSHFVGLAFAVLALAANWTTRLAIIHDYDVEQARAAFGETRESALAGFDALAMSEAVTIGGRVVEGDVLLAFWAAQAALLALAGLFGGQSAYELWRARRRAARR